MSALKTIAAWSAGLMLTLLLQSVLWLYALYFGGLSAFPELPSAAAAGALRGTAEVILVAQPAAGAC